MPRHARIRTDAAWTLGSTLLSTEMATLDQNFVDAVNGDGGGSYTNTVGTVSIGGAGLRLAVAQHQLNGSSANVTFSTANPLTLGDSDYPVLGAGHTAASRNMMAHAAEAIWVRGVVRSTTTSAAVSAQPGARLWMPFAVHHGARLTTLQIETVNSAHTGVPATLSSFRPIAVDVNGNVTALMPASPGRPRPATGAAWGDGNTPYAVQINLPTSPGVYIDRTQFTYWIEIIDESGTNALGGNKYVYTLAVFDSIADLRPY